MNISSARGGAEFFHAMENVFPRHGKMALGSTPWQIGVRAARANLVPGLVLQVAAATFVVAYYVSPGFHGLLQHLVDAQNRFGIFFTMLLRVVFNGILPALFCALVPGLRVRRPWASLLFGMAWWGFMGANVHLFYALQARLWGSQAGVATVLLKSATDMLIFSPFYASPIISIAHLWQDQNYSWRATRLLLGPGWYRRIVMPNQVPGWTFWIPGVLILYSLPTALQMPMSALLGCFWALMCLQIALRSPAAGWNKEKQ
jgi:hypothetical protein